MKRKIDLAAISDRDIIKSFYLSQGFLLIIAVCLWMVFAAKLDIDQWFRFDPVDIIVLGVTSGLVIAGLEIVLDKLLPDAWLDDGGMNTRVFQALSIPHIFLAMLVVAVVEEILFRGVLFNLLGFTLSSLIFGLVHIRYLKKPLMLTIAIALGFYLGWLYMFTGNLFVPMATHFVIDTVLGIVLKKAAGR